MFIQIFANVLFSVSEAMTINSSPLKMVGQIVILIAVVCNLFGLFVLVQTMIEIANIQIEHEKKTVVNNHTSLYSESSVNSVELLNEDVKFDMEVNSTESPKQ